VWLAQHSSTEELRAIKIIEKGKVEVEESFLMEVNIAMKSDHPNIIRIYETWETPDHYILVMEYCSGGELLQEVEDNGCVPED
jgi:calcium-dependent protein kinase